MFYKSVNPGVLEGYKKSFSFTFLCMFITHNIKVWLNFKSENVRLIFSSGSEVISWPSSDRKTRTTLNSRHSKKLTIWTIVLILPPLLSKYSSAGQASGKLTFLKITEALLGPTWLLLNYFHLQSTLDITTPWLEKFQWLTSVTFFKITYWLVCLIWRYSETSI
jgi:hypothetical protein